MLHSSVSSVTFLTSMDNIMYSSDEEDFLNIEEKNFFLNQAMQVLRTNVAQIEESIDNVNKELKKHEYDLKLSHNELKKLKEEEETLQLEAETLEEQLQTLNKESELLEKKYADMYRIVKSIRTLGPIFQQAMAVTLSNMNAIINTMSQEGIIGLQPCTDPESESLPRTQVPSASESLPEVQQKSLSITPVPPASETLQLVQPKGTPVPSTSKSFPKVQPKSLPSTPLSSASERLPTVQPKYLPITQVPSASKRLPLVQSKSLPSTPVPSASKGLPLVQPTISSTKKRKISEEDHIEETQKEEEEEEEKEEEGEEGGEEEEEEEEEEMMEEFDTKTDTATKLPPFLLPYIPKKKSPNDKWPLNYTAFLNYYFETTFKGKLSKEVVLDCIQQGINYNIFPLKQSNDKLYKQVYTRIVHLKRQREGMKKRYNRRQ
ncbi:val protein L homeolog isoform X5 [Xenopus laevis]|uniref:Val protein L homeolog isoform X5 n=1 Tax=Xenopus laevis TaxID=8355 RepID=A0A8J0U725_XENLA|nr:val protein L homeolog isoform X5 [Xenopus laevis]